MIGNIVKIGSLSNIGSAIELSHLEIISKKKVITEKHMDVLVSGSLVSFGKIPYVKQSRDNIVEYLNKSKMLILDKDGVVLDIIKPETMKIVSLTYPNANSSTDAIALDTMLGLTFTKTHYLFHLNTNNLSKLKLWNIHKAKMMVTLNEDD